MQGDHPELDAATANFDNTFTRMPVETDDHPDAHDGGGANDAELLEELHEDTFVGFTFDDQPPPLAAATTTPEAPQSNGVRQRSHHECHEMDHGKATTSFPEERHLD